MQWNTGTYDSNFGFVSAHGRSMIDLLEPQAGESILDLGCGTGDLAAEIAATGARVHGIDADAGMIETARAKHAGSGATFAVADGHAFTLAEPVDKVFSNAALHWMTRPDEVIERVHAALRPGGRFVAEQGAGRNVATLIEGMRTAAAEQGLGDVVLPWYFPSTAEHAGRLERAGFEVRVALYFDRPTPLAPGDTVADWWRMFGPTTLAGFPAEAHDALLRRVDELVKDRQFRDGGWFADYARLRFVAVRR
ncbi:methyltransferase domain-containing protein [Streptomyces sp. SID3343]|nr:methyltransferase domain-containing protein [Streptomyces sp. SID3343]